MSQATPMQFYVLNDKDLERFIKSIEYMVIPKRGYLFQWGLIKNTRTLKQNNALHKWFELLANALNDAGFLIHEEFLGREIEIEWDGDRVKKRIWFKPMFDMTGKEHTAELETTEVSEIYEVLNRYFAQNHGIHVPFPELIR